MSSLSGSQFEQLLKALSDAYDRQSLKELLRFELDKSLAEISESDSYREVVFSVIDESAQKGWTEQLISAAHTENPRNRLLREFVAEHFPDKLIELPDPPPVMVPENPYESRCLCSKLPMLDRRTLRRELRKLNSASKCVLVVTGERHSGKSYSLELIKHLKKETKAFELVWCDLVDLSDKAENGEITPLLLGNEIVSQMGFDPIERGTEQESRWTKNFPTELKRLLTARGSENCYWIVIDHFDSDRILVNQGTYGWIMRLAKRIQQDMDNLRLVLLEYKNYDQLDSELYNLGHDPIPVLKKEDVQGDLTDFFLDLFEARKRHKNEDYTPQDIAQAINRVQKSVDLEKPRWLELLSKALTKEANNICD